MQISRMFIKNWLYQEQRPVEDNENVMKNNF